MTTFITLLSSIIWILSIFILCFSSLVVIKTIYSFIKVLVLKEGTIEHDKKTQLYFALALSYIITFFVV